MEPWRRWTSDSLRRSSPLGERELFFSDEKAENSVTSVLGLCFVVTLSQFKRGVAYLHQSNPLIEEKNLFFAHKKYDRAAQLLHVWTELFIE